MAAPNPAKGPTNGPVDPVSLGTSIQNETNQALKDGKAAPNNATDFSDTTDAAIETFALRLAEPYFDDIIDTLIQDSQGYIANDVRKRLLATDAAGLVQSRNTSGSDDFFSRLSVSNLLAEGGRFLVNDPAKVAKFASIFARQLQARVPGFSDNDRTNLLQNLEKLLETVDAAANPQVMEASKTRRLLATQARMVDIVRSHPNVFGTDYSRYVNNIAVYMHNSNVYVHTQGGGRNPSDAFLSMIEEGVAKGPDAPKEQELKAAYDALSNEFGRYLKLLTDSNGGGDDDLGFFLRRAAAPNGPALLASYRTAISEFIGIVQAANEVK